MRQAIAVVVLTALIGVLPAVARAAEPAAQAQTNGKSAGKKALFWTGIGVLGVGAMTMLVGATDDFHTSGHKRTLVLTGAAVAGAGAVTIIASANRKNQIAVNQNQVVFTRRW